MGTSVSHSIRLATALGVTLAMLATSAQAQEIVRKGEVTGVRAAAGAAPQVDFANAKPFKLPQIPESYSVQAQQDLIANLVNQFQTSAAPDSGEVAGAEGDGSAFSITDQLGTPSEALDTQAGGGVGSQEHGTFNRPFSTARADFQGNPTNGTYPYRAAGKLYFFIPGQGTSWCSASLIKRGVIVTAAHCVADYGQRRFYTNFRFVPGERNLLGRSWSATTAWVLTSYFTGIPASQCAVAGIVCTSDVAVIELAPQTNPTYPGTSTGWYGYGWNRFGFTSSGLTHITQLGYPAGLDSGRLMQRNDSQGFIASSALSGNTLIGSLMNGGSSGGPWVLNFGWRPILTGTTNGSFPSPNIVIGVTSWGYISSAPKEQGASPFTSTNIVPLVNAACAGSDPRCL
ncbi:MAG: trypsin-like serine peptidase [Nitrospiraceae bacterium]